MIELYVLWFRLLIPKSLMAYRVQLYNDRQLRVGEVKAVLIKVLWHPEVT